MSEQTPQPFMPPQQPPGGGGGGSGSSAPNDGQVVKGQTSTGMYLIAGGAKFLIASMDELAALGYSIEQVRTILDRELQILAVIPRQGTVLRERDRPAWYVLANGVAILVPADDALWCLGYAASAIRVIPPGGLARNGIPQWAAPSASATPSSMFFTPNSDFSRDGNRWARTEVPGHSLPNGNRIVELRGWLRRQNSPLTGDPDYHWGLEIDPQWLDQLGVDLGSFVKVGDVLMFGKDRPPGWPWAFATAPTLHMEINGWDMKRGKPPVGWDVDGAAFHVDNVVWPYDPMGSGGDPNTPLTDGRYVRVSGSLVTDQPHSRLTGEGGAEWWHAAFGGDVHSEELYATAARIWEGAAATQDEGNPARWTEMHPPDIIEFIDPPARQSVWVQAVAVVCSTAAIDPFPTYQEFTGELAPPVGTQPPNTKLAIQEFVGGETRFGSIVEGNGARNGAAISLTFEKALIHVKVRGEAFQGAPGKFKAVYRMTWEPKGKEKEKEKEKEKDKERKDGKDVMKEKDRDRPAFQSRASGATPGMPGDWPLASPEEPPGSGGMPDPTGDV